MIGSNIVDPNIEANRGVVGEYRFIHEYCFNQVDFCSFFLSEISRSQYKKPKQNPTSETLIPHPTAPYSDDHQ